MRRRNYFSMLLIVVMLVSLFRMPTVSAGELVEMKREENGSVEFIAPDIIAPEEVISNGYVGRAEHLEKDLYSFIFENEDGSNTLRLFEHPVKYLDENGNVQDISTNIIAMPNGNYQTEANEIVTIFHEKLSDGIMLEYDDIEISMIPEENLAGEISSIGSKTVSYPYGDKTTLEYSLTYTGFKEDIVVEEYTGQTEYSFRLITNGLFVSEIDGSYFLVDSENEIRASIGDIIVFTADEKNNTLGRMTSSTVLAGEEYLLTIHLDEEYLRDEKTVYPIRIDPTLEITYANNGNDAIEDVSIHSGASSNGSLTSLYVGKHSSFGISRILMRFPRLNTDILPGEYQIVSAYVEIRDLLCESTAMNLECYLFAGNSWSELGATWSSVSPNSLGAKLATRTISYAQGANLTTEHRYQINITNAVKGWKSGEYDQNKGIIFKAPDSVENGSTYLSKTFASFNHSGYKPSLIINYRTIITGNTVSTLSTLSRNLAANTAYKDTFVPEETGWHSIWTTGSTDTHISVYQDTLLENCVGYDDDDGHGLNACLTLYLTSGTTYYIMIQGATASTTGNYISKYRRGLPTSGSELGSNFSIFNSSSYIETNNCYTYALNAWVNPITGETHEIGELTPGGLSGSPISWSDMADAETAKTAIVAAVKSDCVAWGGSASDFYEVNFDTMVPEGYYKVALFLKPGTLSRDFHWYRQVSDLYGKWTHKRGTAGQAMQTDGNGNYIYEAENAVVAGYTEFLGYFALRPPAYYSMNTLEAEIALTEQKMPVTKTDEAYVIKEDISLGDFYKFVAKKSTLDEVKNIIGEAHDTQGMGYIGYTYYTTDGYKVTIYYCMVDGATVVDVIVVQDNNGVGSILAQ